MTVTTIPQTDILVAASENPAVKKFIKLLVNPITFRLGMLAKLPMGLVTGLRIRSLDTNHATVTVPYRWLNKNPFKSTYFAVLSMAAEMSTGLLALMAVEYAGVPVSTYVTGLQADFVKTAKDVTSFKCIEGRKIFEAVQHTAQTGEPVSFEVSTIGTNKAGVEVARFKISWSVKRKS